MLSNAVVMKLWLFLTLTTAVLMACQTQPPAVDAARTSQSQYVEETGHTIDGEFLHYFNRFGGVKSLGYPLTDQIVVDGWRVQYFEYGRLEYHPENEPAYRITVGWLGDLLNRRRPPLSSDSIPRLGSPNSRYFPQTGHTISGDFLHYFEANGGTVRFGAPISEPFLWEGQLSQDFQSARFFWTPGHGPVVRLEDIGRVHLNQISRPEKK